MNAYAAELRLVWIAAGVVAIAGIGYFGFRFWQRRSRRKALLHRLERISYDAVHQVLGPDGMGGWIHIDHLLLTQRGVIALDTRRVAGVIFGGDQMSDWTVMSRKYRYTFDNPQPALYDRVAAVKQLAGETPVEGRLLFSNVGKFTKGMPKWVLMLDDLEVDIPIVNRSARSAPEFAATNDNWEQLKSQLRPSPHVFTSL